MIIKQIVAIKYVEFMFGIWTTMFRQNVNFNGPCDNCCNIFVKKISL